MRITVLTFNTLGTPFFAPRIAKRYKKIAALLSSSDIDIVCFQEIFSHYNRYIMDRGMTKAFPYRVYKSFLPGLYGGLAIYSKIPITFESFHTFSGPKGVKIPSYTKLAHNGILVAKLNNIPLTIATTHLTSDIVHNLTPQNKFYSLINSQLQEAAEQFNKLTEKKESVLLVGDFNTARNSELYNHFLKVSGAHDMFAKSDTFTYAPDRISYPFPAKTTDRIDFIFYKEGSVKINPEKLRSVFEDPVEMGNGKLSYLSDHVGLAATLVLI